MYGLGVGSTDTGQTRDRNEDRLYVDNRIGLYIVCDGMGGHQAGEIAATIALDSASRSVMGQQPTIERIRAGRESSTKLAQIAEEAVQAACRDVCRASTEKVGRAGMGTTLTLLLVAGRKAVMAHVGDTRLYLIRDGAVHALSKDHTLAAEMAQSGTMTEVEASERYSHVLTRALGMQVSVRVDTLLLDVVAGDRFLLCSDGLTRYTEDPNDLTTLLGAPDLDEIPDQLIELANQAGGADNITALVVAIEDDPETSGTSLEELAVAQANLEVLASTSPFEDLSLARLQRLLNACRVQTFEPGEVMVDRGESLAGLTVLLDGKIAALEGRERIGELGQGDVFGESTLFEEREARCTLRATELTRCLTLSRESFRGLIRRRPWLGLELFERLGRRTSATVERAISRLPAEVVRELPVSDRC